MWMGFIQSAELLNRTKWMTVLHVRENSSASLLKTRTSPFPALGLSLIHQLFLDIKPARLWVASLQFQHADFQEIHTHTHTHKYPISFLSLRNPDQYSNQKNFCKIAKLEDIKLQQPVECGISIKIKIYINIEFRPRSTDQNIEFTTRPNMNGQLLLVKSASAFLCTKNSLFNK